MVLRFESVEEIPQAVREVNPDLAKGLQCTSLELQRLLQPSTSQTGGNGHVGAGKGKRRHPEKDLEQFVHDTARTFGLLYYHTYRSRFSEPGFPDCIILGKTMLVVELKDTGKNPTLAQHNWLNAFGMIGIEVRLWHPEDKEIIIETLREMSQSWK